jgi:metal-responsive CopG/Arc/MetJ family transcriptional regulator
MPRGNPNFGTKHKFDQIYSEKLAKKQLQIRLPESIQAELDKMPADERNELVRNAIAFALKKKGDHEEE